jgi:ribonuclease P protein component
LLPAEHRLTKSAQFVAAVREGRRAGGRNLVIHLKSRESGEPALVGFVVSKAVGNAVIRNRVKRRLRAIMAERWLVLPAGSLVVVRALPACAGSDFSTMVRDVERSLDRVLDRPAT